MQTNRREFLGQLSTSAAMLGVMPLTSRADAIPTGPALIASSTEDFDLTWVTKLTGKHKAVFDVPEVESGYGVWRASIWGAQYQDVLKIPAKDLTAVLVLRHNGIALAMQQSYWDKYGVGKAKNVTHPITQKATDRNPAMLSSARNEQPAELDSYALDKFIARGGIALACNLAFQDCVDTIATRDNVAPDAARKQALAYLVPGVNMQPSGVFAAIRAQEGGCVYLRAS